MSNHIKNIEISNFKSIKDLKFDGCKKINVLVGFPNAGKSNILEALGPFGLFDFKQKHNIKDFVRFDEYSELFFEGNTKENSQITTDKLMIVLNITGGELHAHRTTELTNGSIVFKSNNDSIHSYLYDRDKNDSVIKKYFYKRGDNLVEDLEVPYLIYPFGGNMNRTIYSNPSLRNFVREFFLKNNLKLLIEKNSNKLKIFKEYEDGTVFTLPYSMIADTLQRLIFFKAAIMSNENSVLLFEEPEAHCFEPYILELTNAVKYDENNNQFFIVTHSQFVIDELLRDEESRINTQIYLVNNIDNKTQVKKLNEENNDDVYQYGMNVFFNFENLWQTN